MNSLTTNGKLTEMECGANFAVILKDNAFFLPTEYKVLQSQKDGCFVKCMRMLYNGKTELYYFAGELKSLSSLLSTIDAERFLTVLCNLLGAIINVQSNGFLTCRNIDASFERIYIDPNTYKVNLVYSACGGTGKTTVAMGISASLTKNYKRVLYINAARLQVFQHMLENPSAITAADVYTKLSTSTDSIYENIKHVIRKELFSYLPPFKAALMSLGLPYSVFERIIISAKKSREYDFIVVDADITFDEDKATLLNIADKVLVVTKQNLSSVIATNILVANINGANTEKYSFVCNDFDKEKDNSLISPNVSVKFSIDEYIEHFRHYDKMSPDDFSKENSIQKAAFLTI